MTDLMDWLTPTRRAWLYRVLLAALPLLIFYGVLSEEAAPLWIAFAGVILGSGVASAFTSTKVPESDQD